MWTLIGKVIFQPNGRRAKYSQLPEWRLKYVTSRNVEISPEHNKESISPPNQHKRDTDTVVPEGWKLGKDASPDVADVV